MRIRWARSATKHRIARRRSRYVIQHSGLRFRVPPPQGIGDDRLLYLGDDDAGEPLEVMAVELEGDELLRDPCDADEEQVQGAVRGGDEMARVKTRSGKRISSEKVAELGKEAERGYDLSKAKRERVQPGRPSLDEGVSPRITYRVAKSTYVRAKKTAKEQGRTVSEVAREALERYVSRQQDPIASQTSLAPSGAAEGEQRPPGGPS